MMGYIIFIYSYPAKIGCTTLQHTFSYFMSQIRNTFLFVVHDTWKHWISDIDVFYHAWTCKVKDAAIITRSFFSSCCIMFSSGFCLIFGIHSAWVVWYRIIWRIRLIFQALQLELAVSSVFLKKSVLGVSVCPGLYRQDSVDQGPMAINIDQNSVIDPNVDRFRLIGIERKLLLSLSKQQ